MRDRTLITTGVIGGALAAICCATPLLVVVFGAIGLTAWLSRSSITARSVALFRKRHDPGIPHHLSALRHREDGNHADRRLPVFCTCSGCGVTLQPEQGDCCVSVPTARCRAADSGGSFERDQCGFMLYGNPRVVSDTPICWHGGYLRPAFLPVCLSRCRFEPRSGSPRSSGWGQRAQALRAHPFPLPGPHSCIIGKKRTRSVSLLLRAAQRSDRRRTRRHGTA
jgi:hypothetical protein